MKLIVCYRLLGANADILQLSNSLSGPARLHLVSGDELRVITRSDEPLENLLGVCYDILLVFIVVTTFDHLMLFILKLSPVLMKPHIIAKDIQVFQEGSA